MSARLPSWFWLLLCIASFAGSVLAWRLESPSRGPAAASAEAAVTSDSSVDAPDISPPLAGDLAALGELPAPAPADARAAAATFTAAPPSDSVTGTKVLRCVVRGRVTYVDVTSACADGSAGKITVLPR
jgi:hypothetical protein